MINNNNNYNKNNDELMDVINILNNSSARFQNNIKNKKFENAKNENISFKTDTKSKLKEMITPNFMNYIMGLEKNSNNDKNKELDEVMQKDDFLDSNSKKLNEDKDDNYNDLCNNICTNSESIKFKEKNENEKLKEEINKEIEDMYQLSLKNSQNKNLNNRKNINNNIQKEIIKPMENSNNYFLYKDDFKENNTEFI